MLTEEIRDTVNKAIEQLPEDLRTAIVLREMEGMSKSDKKGEYRIKLGGRDKINRQQ